MFEKLRDKMIIHEMNYNNKGFVFYKKFEKLQNSKRNVLISQDYRQIKK